MQSRAPARETGFFSALRNPDPVQTLWSSVGFPKSFCLWMNCHHREKNGIFSYIRIKHALYKNPNKLTQILIQQVLFFSWRKTELRTQDRTKTRMLKENQPFFPRFSILTRCSELLNKMTEKNPTHCYLHTLVRWRIVTRRAFVPFVQTHS